VELKNGKSRDTGNHGYTTHKTNKNKHTTQIAKRMSNTDPTKTPGVNQGCLFCIENFHGNWYEYSYSGQQCSTKMISEVINSKAFLFGMMIGHDV
jgi:hypothetical protein